MIFSARAFCGSVRGFTVVSIPASAGCLGELAVTHENFGVRIGEMFRRKFYSYHFKLGI